jgi:hypothetical protein
VKRKRGSARGVMVAVVGGPVPFMFDTPKRLCHVTRPKLNRTRQTLDTRAKTKEKAENRKKYELTRSRYQIVLARPVNLDNLRRL